VKQGRDIDGRKINSRRTRRGQRLTPNGNMGTRIEGHEKHEKRGNRDARAVRYWKSGHVFSNWIALRVTKTKRVQELT
jgi:hypothetical protein